MEGPSTLPNVTKAGEVLAQLNDWRAILYVLVFIIVCMIIERVWMQHNMVKERQQMREVAASFATSAEKVGEALSGLRVEVMVLRALSSRVEATTVAAAEGEPHV